jgi:dUTP pyrophosphatase
MYRKQLQIVKLSDRIPDIKRETTKSAGLDLYADLEASFILNPFERKLIGTGIKAIAPSGFHIEIRPRSGLAIKHGITVLNSPGTIDEDYKEEIKIILINLSMEPYIINPGDRIAQMVLVPVSLIEPVEVNSEQFDKLFETVEMNTRVGGFGSTGK